jgi:ADP-ribose pyrophosphatase
LGAGRQTGADDTRPSVPSGLGRQPLWNPISQLQPRHTLEMALVVRGQRQRVMQGDAGDLQVRFREGRTRPAEDILEFATAPRGTGVKGQHGHASQQKVYHTIVMVSQSGTTQPPQPDDAGAWVRILDEVEDYRFGHLFRIVRARLQHRRFDGQMSPPITRINFERGDSVGVLLYDPRADAVVLVRQFRYPVYARLSPAERAGEGARQAWLLEIVAGVQEDDHSLQEVANRELLEEAGYQVKAGLQTILTFYPSPGGTSERVTVFMAEVDSQQRAGKGGGVKAEGEDIQIVVVPFQEAMEMLYRGEIQDAKTIIALQYLALHKARRATESSG